MNNKKRQSSLYKKKAIDEHIRQWIKREADYSFGFYGDNKLYQKPKVPSNIHYGYKVKKFAYKINVIEKEYDIDSEGLLVKGVLVPIYHMCKVIKI